MNDLYLTLKNNIVITEKKRDKIIMKLRHILMEHKYMLEDILRKLLAGESLESLATKFSICSSSSKGGDLGKVRLASLDPTFCEFVENLRVGERTVIFKTRFGHHIVERYE